MARYATLAAGRLSPGESGESGGEPSLDIQRELVRGESAGYAPHARMSGEVCRESRVGRVVSDSWVSVRHHAAQRGATARAACCGWRRCGVVLERRGHLHRAGAACSAGGFKVHADCRLTFFRSFSFFARWDGQGHGWS